MLLRVCQVQRTWTRIECEPGRIKQHLLIYSLENLFYDMEAMVGPI
jgi:hypothetical protein